MINTQDFLDAAAREGTRLVGIYEHDHPTLYHQKSDGEFVVVEATAGDDVVSALTSKITMMLLSVASSITTSRVTPAEAEVLGMTPQDVSKRVRAALEKNADTFASIVKDALLEPVETVPTLTPDKDSAALLKKYAVGKKADDGGQLPASGQGNRPDGRSVHKRPKR